MNKTRECSALVDEMMEHLILKDFVLDVQSLPGGRNFRITFDPNDPRSRRARRNLLRFLAKHKTPIVWKECRHGYEINQSGRILRKWPLTNHPSRITHLTP